MSRTDAQLRPIRPLHAPGAGRLRAWGWRALLELGGRTIGEAGVLRVARRIGEFGWEHLPLLHREVRATIEAALRGTHAPEQIERIARAYAVDLLVGFVETDAVFRVIRADTWRRHVRLSGVEPALGAVRAGRGVIGVGLYHGNHQVGMTAMGHLLGGRVAGIVSPWQYPVQYRWMRGLLRRRLAQLYPTHAGLEAAVRALRRGFLLLTIAEHDRDRPSGVEVEFLGRRRRVHPTASLLALRTGCPIAVVSCRRLDAPLRFEIALHDWIEPPPVAPKAASTDPPAARREWVRQTTVRIMERLDAVVRRWPEQYAWARQHHLAGRDRV